MSAPSKSLAGLLRAAGTRPAPDAEMALRVGAAVYQEYIAMVARRRRRAAWVATAAGLLALLAAALYVRQSAAEPVVVGRAARIFGAPARVEPAGAAVALDERLHVGDTVELAPASRLFIALRNGIGMRVNEGTTFDFEAPDRLRVERGAVYIETPRGNPEAAYFSVVTAHGSVHHVGTRFEVAVSDSATRIRVRDGAAVFRSTNGASATVTAGEQLDYRGGVASVVPGPGPASPAWRWTEQAAPEFRVDGRTLLEAVDWFAHEAGLKLEFHDAATCEAASTVILHGSVGGLAPREAIAAVMAGSNLPYAIQGGDLLLGTH